LAPSTAPTNPQEPSENKPKQRNENRCDRQKDHVWKSWIAVSQVATFREQESTSEHRAYDEVAVSDVSNHYSAPTLIAYTSTGSAPKCGCVIVCSS
jgi:hypothetical protein